jgi:hypothetical protein
MKSCRKRYGHITSPNIAVLSMEVNLDALRIARQNELSDIYYHNLMVDRLDEVSDERVKALGEIERDKLRIARAYNKKVKKIISSQRSCLEDDSVYWV